MDVWARFLRKKALEGQIPRGSFRDREVFHGRANLVPKVFLAGAGFGGKSHHRHARVLLAEAAHRQRQGLARDMSLPDIRSHLVAMMACGRPREVRNSSNWRSLSCAGMLASTSAKQKARVGRSCRRSGVAIV